MFNFPPKISRVKEFPGLDSIDYFDAENPGVALLYYSTLSHFPKESEGVRLIYAQYKQECLDIIIRSLYTDIHVAPHGFIKLDKHLDNIKRFIETIRPDTISKDYYSELLPNIENLLTKSIKNTITEHNLKLPFSILKVSNMKKWLRELIPV